MQTHVKLCDGKRNKIYLFTDLNLINLHETQITMFVGVTINYEVWNIKIQYSTCDVRDIVKHLERGAYAIKLGKYSPNHVIVEYIIHKTIKDKRMF